MNLGKTGKFPKGKLNKDDEGEIQLAIAADVKNKVVRIEFGTPVAWLALPAKEAKTFGQMLIDKAGEL